MADKARRPVVFLDRDGTLIHDRPGHYLRQPGKLKLYPCTAEALRLLRSAGYRLVVLSNQSGIGRGYLDHAVLRLIHARLRRELRARGARLDGIYFCPHGPDAGCPCRKPKPLLARRAMRELGLTLRGGAVIGDKKADMDLARGLGIPGLMVKTGHWRSQRARYGGGLGAAVETGNVLTAARWLLRRKGSSSRAST